MTPENGLSILVHEKCIQSLILYFQLKLLVVITSFSVGSRFIRQDEVEENVPLTLVSVTLGDTDHVDHLVLGEHLADGNLLLKVLTGKVDLVKRYLLNSFIPTPNIQAITCYCYASDLTAWVFSL